MPHVIYNTGDFFSSNGWAIAARAATDRQPQQVIEPTIMVVSVAIAERFQGHGQQGERDRDFMLSGEKDGKEHAGKEQFQPKPITIISETHIANLVCASPVSASASASRLQTKAIAK